MSFGRGAVKRSEEYQFDQVEMCTSITRNFFSSEANDTYTLLNSGSMAVKVKISVMYCQSNLQPTQIHVSFVKHTNVQCPNPY